MAVPSKKIRRLRGFILSTAADPQRSFEQGMLAANVEDRLPGTVCGQVTRGAQNVAAVAAAGNAGNGVFAAAPTADAGAAPGVYKIVVEAAAANGGVLGIYDPAGVRIGKGAVAAAFDGAINFTLNDGGVDFAVGDSFDVTVTYAAGSGAYVPYDPDGTDGSAEFAGILKEGQIVSAAATRHTFLVRDAEVKEPELVFVNELDANQKAALYAAMEDKGVIVRKGI